MQDFCSVKKKELLTYLPGDAALWAFLKTEIKGYLLVLILWIPLLFSAKGHEKFSPTEVSSFESIQDLEGVLLKSCLPGGAIALNPEKAMVIPYFANIAGVSLMEVDLDKVRHYMDWYISNLNSPDRFGLYGTIYDFSVDGERLIPTENYDSADSYASTFLSLAFHYLEKTEDNGFIEERIEGFEKVAKVLLTLEDKDGLLVVKPGSKKKYLMDNGENLKGLRDWAFVLRTLGREMEAEVYEEAAARVFAGIERELQGQKGDYAWVSSWYGKIYPRTGVWYPDGVSQISLILNQVFSPDSPQAKIIWQNFNDSFPMWPKGEKDDPFPWVSVALVSAMMGDRGRLEMFLSSYEEKNPRFWHVQECAHFMSIKRMLGSPKETLTFKEKPN